MPSMTQQPLPAALEARVAALVAESLTPVPRASRAVAVDAGDLALVTGYMAEAAAAASAGRGAPRMDAAAAAAWQKLDAAVRGRGWTTA
jgi:hypothetical protein